MQLETFFADGIRKLVDRSNKSMERLGDYIKKWEFVLVYLL
jgi:hypothetical protein